MFLLLHFRYSYLIILNQKSPLASFSHLSRSIPQLFHSKLKTLLFSKSCPDLSSSPYLAHALNLAKQAVAINLRMLKTIVIDFLVFKPQLYRRLSRMFFSASSRLSRNFRGRLAGSAQIAAAGRISRRLRELLGMGQLLGLYYRVVLKVLNKIRSRLKKL